jgi:NADH-quinone oxidoreductase subunit G
MTLQGTGALSDAQVLDALADELDVELGVRTVATARDGLAAFPGYATTSAGSAQAPASRGGGGNIVLATWHELLDAGRGQDGDEYLAATAKAARAMMSADTAHAHGLSEGDQVTVSTDAGSITVPIEVAELPDRVVWLPTNARGSAVRSSLRAVNGAIVTLSPGGAA